MAQPHYVSVGGAGCAGVARSAGSAGGAGSAGSAGGAGVQGVQGVRISVIQRIICIREFYCNCLSGNTNIHYSFISVYVHLYEQSK